MEQKHLWHAYWDRPQQDQYASRFPVKKIILVSHEALLRKHNQKPNKPLNIEKYWIPPEQADFARSIEPKVIKFFGWEHCADIINAYRDEDISALGKALMAFFQNPKKQEGISTQEVKDIFRWITVLDLHNTHIIAETQTHTHHLLNQTEQQLAINNWLIAVKYAIDDKKDHNWMVHPYQIVEALQGSMN